MDAQMKEFWMIGLFFALIGGFIGFLLGFSPNAAITGMAMNDPTYAACFDSDGGRAISAYGYAVAHGERYFDNCEDSLTLAEAYCSADGNIMISKLTCTFGCNNGVCLMQT